MRDAPSGQVVVRSSAGDLKQASMERSACLKPCAISIVAKASTSLLTSSMATASLNYTVLPGKSKALVLSNAEIKDGRYYLPKGKSGTFTLVALVDLNKAPTKENVSLLMTSLPFTMIDKSTKIEAKLNPSELQYYRTPEVDLKK